MKYIAKWNKSYLTHEEFRARLARWIEADDFIREVNAPGSEHTHTAGHNKFSDWTREEYRKMLNHKLSGEAPSAPANEPIVLEDHRDENGVGSEMNWSGKGCTTPIKNQEQCGSCYSFSASETMESSYCITSGTNKLWTLAPQQVVDCDSGNYGCNGGWFQKAWDYYTDHGAMQESEYPYTGYEGSCKYNSSQGVVACNNSNTYYTVDGSSGPMMTAVNTKPMSVTIEADSWVFQTYSSGVITSSSCGQ